MTPTPRRYAFQHAGLDRAEHLRKDAAALDACWPDAPVLILDVEGQARFAGSDDQPEFPRGGQCLAQRPEIASFLGLDEGGQAWFALPAEVLPELPAQTLDLRSAGTRWAALPAAVFAQARALLHWQQRSRYCGACGGALVLERGGFCARCPQCGIEHYPRTDPAIIVAVSDGERLLLGRQASWPPKRWSVLAGFLEPGESLEQTVVREVMEEAGVRVDACQYACSQPWPFPSALMLGFHAQAQPQPAQVSEELEEARWFTAAELRDGAVTGEVRLSPSLSISRWLIDDWLAQQP
ncbi:NAD(+) diphosphatase [Arenimonas oryziterrae]|uniref:NAD(+) diphosphatase n=1 Tax=Arenimonas oryziterrae TaxID=498055 RepID=UPI00041E1FC6|nr:NAD(+) diphosphatase [Arenimonas oryziterrae]